MNTSEVLNLAADEIERRGWSQGTGWFPREYTGPVCLEGSLRAATQNDATVSSAALRSIRAYLTSTRPKFISSHLGYVIAWIWNDHPDRTQAEVLEVLRAAAVIEYGREQQEIAWASYAGCVTA